MAAVSQLGYLGLSVKDKASWRGYARDVLGLHDREEGGALLLRLDSHDHRFAVEESGADDIAYAGWQVASKADLDAVAARLEAAGVAVTAGSAETAERRHVAGLIQFADPDGHAVEVFQGPERDTTPFQSPKGIDAGFVAEDQGLGHFVLFTSDLARAMAFYTDMLGFKVSDYVNMGGGMKLGFLHCNPRHHSIAFAEVPKARKAAHHFMLQLGLMDDVGKTYDQVNDTGIRVLATLGKHSNDHMTSFYMANPSGFGVEYGWGARTIDDACWQVEQFDSGSMWGHRPVK
ncbi:MAG: VOC family protein [Dehalococcoidia bacterium]